MPVQKGKHKTKRERRQFGRSAPTPAPGETVTRAAAPSTSDRRAAKPAVRRRPPAPLWLNVTVGSAMLVLGVFFFVRFGVGHNIGQGLLLLAAYFLLGGFYLFRASRQYRAR